MKSFFTDTQWQWVADRYREGYPMGDLASFLGIHRNSVRRGLIRMGAMPEDRRDLPPLRPRRAEFIRLNRMRGAERFAERDGVQMDDGGGVERTKRRGHVRENGQKERPV